MAGETRRTVLFFPLNSPGHINSSLGIADTLKRECNCRTVFLLLGTMIGTSVQDHGHELITLKEKTPLVDYEIDSDEESAGPVDEEAMRKKGKVKKTFEGVLKWPQLIRRYSKMFQVDPLEAFVKSAEMMEKNMGADLIENHDNYAATIDEIAPDLIVVDAYYIPPCVVKSNRPWARLYSANPLILTESKLENGMKPAPMQGFKLYDKETRARLRNETPPSEWLAMLDEWRHANELIFKAMSSAGGELAKFLALCDCPPPPPGKQAHDSPHLNVYMFPEALDYEQDDDLFVYPKLWLRCDSLMRHQSLTGSKEDKELAVWREKLAKASRGKEAVVFFSLGSLASGNAELMKKYVSYFSHDQKRLYVFSKGVNGDQYELDKGNMIGGNYIPQTFFLQKADLAIIHGGNNSVTECMYYGLPTIVLPVFADQLDNAQRVEDLKLGRRLDVNKCTQEQILQAVDEILSDGQLIERVQTIGRNMRSRDDLQKVARLIERLADQGSLSQEDIDDCRASMK